MRQRRLSWQMFMSMLGLVFVALIFAQVSAWDEEDFAQMRAHAKQAKETGVRYLVENSDYREAAYASAFHCRAPVKDERLVMQLASGRDPGKGYRCVYWRTTRGDTAPLADVTWSRSPELSMRLAPGRPQ